MGDWLRNLQPVCMLAALALVATPAFAHGIEQEGGFGNQFVPVKEGLANDLPKDLEGIGIEEHLGDQVDKNLVFKNEKGETVTIGQYFGGHKPVLLTLAYYQCTSLCNYHLNGLTNTFKEIKAPLGKEFEVVVVSIEPKETPEQATQKKAAYIESYGRPEGAKAWHFLTGTQENIEALAKQVGFKYRWDEPTKQYAHASAAVALTPEGTISRYLYGIVFDPKILRLAMVEASDGKVGTIVDKLNLFCFHIEPKGNKLTLAAFNVMRAGGALIVVVVALFMTPFWYRNRKRQHDSRLQGEP